MWEPKGVLFDKQHAQLPTPFYIGGGLLRIYYSTRINSQSHIRFFDVNEETLEIISIDQEALGPGERGTFDHSGVMPSCVVVDEFGLPMMFYSGWNLKKDVPYSHGIGIALFNVDGTLRRKRLGPVLSHNTWDAYLVNSPYVEINLCEDKNKWKMWYCSGTGWIEDYPTYHISCASGDTAFQWNTTGSCFITHHKKDEAISRVWRDRYDYSFYYAYRTKDEPYSLWQLKASGEKKEVKIERSDWDSEMQCYPAIYDRHGHRYLFYNGNGYGATGIGLATWKKDIG
jgi:hypothetical protein